MALRFKFAKQAALAATFAAALLASGAVAAEQLTVSAAASLTDAFKELGPKFEASQPGNTLRFNFAASGALLQQISQGAPVDVFVSADQATMDRGVSQKLIDSATRKDFVLNSLVLIEPAQDSVSIQTLQDLTNPAVKKIAVGKPATVPAGRYTEEALQTAKLWQPLGPKFVQGDSVRQVLDYVSRGEVEAGFVYRTDAASAGDKVKIVLTATGHTPVSYPVAITADSQHKQLAQDFIKFLDTSEAQALLARYGFSRP